MKKSLFVASIIAVCVAGVYFGGDQIYNVLSVNTHQRDKIILYGNVDIRSVNLSFRVAGRLANLTVDEGDSIKKGQILGTIDDQPYQNAFAQANANAQAAQAKLDLLLAGSRQEDIAQAQAQVEQYQAAFRYAESTYKRQQRLSTSQAISADQLDNAKTARDQARANLQTAKDKLILLQNGARPQEIQQASAIVAQAQATLAEARLNLTDTQLVAPADGVILTRTIEPGTMVASGSPVLTLSLIKPIWVRAYIDEVNLSYAVQGRRVTIASDSVPDKTYNGQIGFVSPTAEFTPKTVETSVLRTSLVYRLRIIVDDADEGLRQGMPVTITFKPNDE